MIVERPIFERELVNEQTRPIFEEEGTGRVYRHPEFSYYPDERWIILRDEREIKLTPRENDIFMVLVKNASKVMSHAQIDKAIRISDNNVRQYIGTLKKKVQPSPEDSPIIYSIGQKRYMLQDPSRLPDQQGFPGFVYMPERHSVITAEKEGEKFLTIKQKLLFDLLIRHSGQLVEKSAIAQALYGDKEGTKLVAKGIQGLRRTVGDCFKQEDGTFRFIVGVPGKGYKLRAN